MKPPAPNVVMAGLDPATPVAGLPAAHAAPHESGQHQQTTPDADWLFGRRTVEARADVDIEKTAESFHAYAVPDGIEIRPGDIVTVHGVPTDIGFGDRLLLQCPATVSRAGRIERLWTKLTAFSELTELYEVGFMPKETP